MLEVVRTLKHTAPEFSLTAVSALEVTRITISYHTTERHQGGCLRVTW